MLSHPSSVNLPGTGIYLWNKLRKKYSQMGQGRGTCPKSRKTTHFLEPQNNVEKCFYRKTLPRRQIIRKPEFAGEERKPEFAVDIL